MSARLGCEIFCASAVALSQSYVSVATPLIGLEGSFAITKNNAIGESFNCNGYRA
jgi:hypothetical protein